MKYIMILSIKIKARACGTSVLTALKRFDPRSSDTIAEIAVFVWATIHIIADKKEPIIPAAAITSTGFSVTLPITAISVNEIKGTAIPAMMAGMASCLISLKLILVFSIYGLIEIRAMAWF